MARVLVIDDENNIRLMVRIALQAVGHEVATASDGPEGLEKFGGGENWDVVLLDQRMPGMEGLEVLREIRKRDATAKVVMITAFGTIDLAASALNAGAAGFLRKPFTTEILRGAVEATKTDIPQAALPQQRITGFGATTINGFRITSAEDSSAIKTNSISGIQHSFQVRDLVGEITICDVSLPIYMVELVKAHTDREEINEPANFWLWLCEEGLANYLWQNAELPPHGKLQVDDLTTALRRWIDAVLQD